MISSEWIEAADRVFYRRYEPFDVNVVAVLGESGLALVDTRAGLGEAREVREHLRGLTSLPVRWVVNTHVHFDHVWGNAEFVAPRQQPPAALWAHEATAAAMRHAATDPGAAEFKARLAAQSPEWAASMAELEEVIPDHLVTGDLTQRLDLGGGRVLELRRLGRGHTDGDLLIRVPDANTVLTGDLVEQSGPPAFGPDSFPLDWPDTLDALLDWTAPGTVYVPGHGTAVDRRFVTDQRDAVHHVAEAFRTAHADGATPAETLASSRLPFSAKELEHAAARAWAQLDGRIH
ncbi:MBL fold metallo-hydrolase [Streptacidiphilus monticola]|uniref:MBL fold metallo-hydrolase n=1 Tax=Streptacidiphilus monticola TaxID=2161674 RepID=A0ABW1G2F8_9ACTN